MFLGAHIITGLIIGKVTGNYSPALIGALVIDIDHVFVYLKHGVFASPQKFWNTITSPEDPYGNQRNYLHSFITWTVVSAALVLINKSFGIIFSLGYASHLILDLLDTSDFYPLYPLKKIKVPGVIGYLSKSEIIITFALVIVFFLI